MDLVILRVGALDGYYLTHLLISIYRISIVDTLFYSDDKLSSTSDSKASRASSCTLLTSTCQSMERILIGFLAVF